MININFLVGMPRAGNTILSSILNQNPNVKMSAHSILPTLLDSILQIKNHERFLNFPDDKFANIPVQLASFRRGLSLWEVKDKMHCYAFTGQFKTAFPLKGWYAFRWSKQISFLH